MKIQQLENKMLDENYQALLQIKVQCRSDGMSNLILNSAEICAFFANLLDNAIEASEKCQAKDMKVNVY